MAHEQFFATVGVDNDLISQILVPYGIQAWPSGASLPAPPTQEFGAGGVVAVAWSSSLLTGSFVQTDHAAFGWASNRSGMTVTEGLQLSVAQLFRLPAGGSSSTNVIVRVFMSTPIARIDEAILVLHDTGNLSNTLHELVTSQLIQNQWIDLTFALDQNTTGWTGPSVGVSLNIKGTSNAPDVGATFIAVESFQIAF